MIHDRFFALPAPPLAGHETYYYGCIQLVATQSAGTHRRRDIWKLLGQRHASVIDWLHSSVCWDGLGTFENRLAGEHNTFGCVGTNEQCNFCVVPLWLATSLCYYNNHLADADHCRDAVADTCCVFALICACRSNYCQRLPRGSMRVFKGTLLNHARPTWGVPAYVSLCRDLPRVTIRGRRKMVVDI
eukprot:5368062-Pleurochrysis_carterae.AAC.4